jgi:hypothetical protein
MACIPACRAAGVDGNGLSPISSSMTRFPCAFSRLATARTPNAPSSVTERANFDDVTIMGMLESQNDRDAEAHCSEFVRSP